METAENHMSRANLSRWRGYFTALVLLAELAHLAWEHFHGGVRSHHILNRGDLPAISNAWGMLLLPALTWFLTGRTQRRIERQSSANAVVRTMPPGVVAGFLGALLVGIALSAAFAMGSDTVPAYIAQGIIVLAILLPIYRAECLLGFVLAMTFTFGAVLPTAVGSVFAALSALMHLLVYPCLRHLWAWLRRR
jgi:hypothetical protein